MLTKPRRKLAQALTWVSMSIRLGIGARTVRHNPSQIETIEAPWPDRASSERLGRGASGLIMKRIAVAPATIGKRTHQERAPAAACPRPAVKDARIVVMWTDTPYAISPIRPT